MQVVVESLVINNELWTSPSLRLSLTSQGLYKFTQLQMVEVTTLETTMDHVDQNKADLSQKILLDSKNQALQSDFTCWKNITLFLSYR